MLADRDGAIDDDEFGSIALSPKGGPNLQASGALDEVCGDQFFKARLSAKYRAQVCAEQEEVVVPCAAVKLLVIQSGDEIDDRRSHNLGVRGEPRALVR
jgi:hypothetical protein